MAINPTFSDVAGMHALVQNVHDESHHFLTAQAIYYRMELMCNNIEDIIIKWVGDDEWHKQACLGCNAVYNPDTFAQILCLNCTKWCCLSHEDFSEGDLEAIKMWKSEEGNEEEILEKNDIFHDSIYNKLEEADHVRIPPTSANDMDAFKRGPIVRGLGWEPYLYPNGVAPADRGWLVTGNEKVSRFGGDVYPGNVFMDMAWTYDVDSAGTPDSVATAMYQGITSVTSYWKCPNCGGYI